MLTKKIPAINLIGLTKEIERLNRRARKNGLPEMQMIVGPKKFRKIESQVEPYYDVQIVGEVKTIEGYGYVAKIEHMRSGTNLVKSMDENVSLKFTEYKPNCEHCKSNRYRKETHILSKDGVEIQVGTECIKNYMTLKSAAYLLGMASYLKEVEAAGEDDYMGIRGGRREDYVNTVVFVATCIESVGKYGWEPSSGSDYGTRIKAWYHLLAKRDKDFVDRGITATEESKKRVEDFIANMGEPGNVFMSNLKVILNEEYINEKNAGIASVAAKIILQAEAVKKEKATRLNEYFGAVNDKIEIDLLIKNKLTLDTMYGEVRIVIMLDKEGRTFMTKSSGDFGDKVRVGDEVKVKGTIKAHNEYKETKQTVLTRVKLISTVKEAA